MSIKIGIKYCGNCNPRINSSEVLELVKTLLPDDCLFGDVNLEEKDVLLVLSGCPVDCVEFPEFKGPKIRVAGETIDQIFCSSDKLVIGIIKLLGNIRTEIEIKKAEE